MAEKESEQAVLILIVAGGPEKGQVYEVFEHQAAVLGREGDPFTFDDRRCSREHARLWHEQGNWHIEDCGSRHGTYVNRRRVEGKTALSDGDRVQMGKTVFVVAQVATERAERLALLGAGPAGQIEPADVASQPARRPYVMAVAAMAAAAIVVGVNLYTHMQVAHRQQLVSEKVTSLQELGLGGAAMAEGGYVAGEEVVAALAERDERMRESLDAIHEAVGQGSTESQAMLGQVLAQGRDQRAQLDTLAELRDLLEQSRRALEPIEQAIAQSEERTHGMLEQSFAQLREQADRDTAMAELAALIRQQGERAEARLALLLEAQEGAGDHEAVLAAIGELGQRMPGDTSALLRELAGRLEAIEAQRAAAEDARLQAALAEIELLSDKIQREVAQAMAEARSAAEQAAREEAARQRFDVEADRLAMGSSLEAIEAMLAEFKSQRDAPLAMDGRVGGESLRTPAARTGRLTALEAAYKQAFETGEVVTVGQGMRNPLTGELSRGRDLDPAAARAAGARTWREWYVMDDFNERSRIQRQALMHGRVEGEPVVRLPIVRSTLQGEPEPTDEADDEEG